MTDHAKALEDARKLLRHPSSNVQELARALIARSAEVEELRVVCAEAHQLAGAVGAPLAALDNLSAAASGKPLPHKTFLPLSDGDFERVEELRAERDGLIKAVADHVTVRGEYYERVRVLEAALENIKKVRDGYASQAKFADVDPAHYFREFVTRIDRALASKEG